MGRRRACARDSRLPPRRDGRGGDGAGAVALRLVTSPRKWGRELVSAGIAAARRLVKEPGAPLRLVDEGFQQTGAGDVVVLFAGIVRFAHGRDQALIVVA